MDKKKTIIAIISLVFLGLLVFSFTNPNNEENNNELKNNESSNTTTTTTTKVTTTKVTKKSKNTKKEDYTNIISLVSELEESIKNATNKEMLVSAKEFEQINEITKQVETIKDKKLAEELNKVLAESFKILNDEIPPKINIEDGKKYNTKLTLNVEDENEVVILLNDNEIENSYEIKEDGEYTLVVTDKAFNTTTIKYSIDTKLPVATVAYDILTLTNTSVKATITIDEEIIAIEGWTKVDEKTYTKVYDENTIESLNIMDLANNNSTLEIKIENIDKTKPTLKVGEKIYNDSETIYSKETFKPEVVETNLETVKFNDIDYIENTDINEDGIFVVTDKAGNIATINVVIDQVAPTISGIVEGITYNKLIPVIEDLNPVTATLNGEEYIVGTIIDTDGSYTLITTDAAGNATTINFEISKDVISFEDVVENEYYQTSIIPIINSTYTLTSIKLNGVDYVVGTQIIDDDEYTLEVIDEYGNTSSVSFVIDTTSPIISTPEIESEVVGMKDATLNVEALVIDNIDSNKNIKPIVTHSIYGELGELDTINISKEYIGKYTLTYNTVDEAGNIATEVVKEFDVIDKAYIIEFTNDDVYYYDKNTTINPEVIVKNTETGEIVVPADGEIIYSIINATTGTNDVIKNAGRYIVEASSTIYESLPITTEFEIEKREVTLVYTHKNEALLNDIFRYEFDGETEPYIATLVDINNNVLETLTISYNGGVLPNIGVYTMDVTYDADNYILTNGITEQAFEIIDSE